MRNEVDLFLRHTEHFLQEPRGVLAHHNETIGERGDLVHHNTLIRVRLAQHRMQSRHHWHLQAPQQPQDVAAGRASENPVLMLKRNQVNIAEVKKVGGIFIGLEGSPSMSSNRTRAG